MSTEVITQTLAAGVTATFGSGRVFGIKSLTGTVDVVARSHGAGGLNRVFKGLPAGVLFEAAANEPGFDTLEVTSAGGDVISIAVGNDKISFPNAVSVVGTVTTVASATGTVTPTPADIAIAATTTDSTSIPANPARKSIAVGVVSTAAGPVRVRSFGGAGGLEIQPGMYATFTTTARLDVRNDGAAATSFYLFEQS